MPLLSANQLVAYNLMRIRKTLGLSQGEAREQLEPYLGAKWSKAVYSAAERSYDGKRVRQFSADDLLAMAAAFSVPVVYFFLPPPPKDRADGAELRSGSKDVSWRDLFEVIAAGRYRASIWHRMLELPPEDRPALNSDTDVALYRLSLNPPDGPLGRMEAIEPEGQS